jgi:hypothetical protein
LNESKLTIDALKLTELVGIVLIVRWNIIQTIVTLVIARRTQRFTEKIKNCKEKDNESAEAYKRIINKEGIFV